MRSGMPAFAGLVSFGAIPPAFLVARTRACSMVFSSIVFLSGVFVEQVEQRLYLGVWFRRYVCIFAYIAPCFSMKSLGNFFVPLVPLRDSALAVRGFHPGTKMWNKVGFVPLVPAWNKDGFNLVPRFVPDFYAGTFVRISTR